MTLPICDRWGRLGLERVVPPIEGLLAATAIEHRLTLVTRNVVNVAAIGVDALNPCGTSATAALSAFWASGEPAIEELEHRRQPRAPVVPLVRAVELFVGVLDAGIGQLAVQ